jgi:O-antigen/teichoic acid export membrane protein
MATPPPPTPSVRRNIAWSTIGNVFYNLCLWGMMVVLARSDPSAQRVGLFAIGYAVNLPIFMFFSLQLRAVQATDARRSYAFSDYFTLRLLSLPAAFLVLALVLLAGPYDGVTARTIAAVALVKTLDLLSDCFQGLFQQHERMRLTAISLIARGTVAFTALVVGLRATGDLTTAILLMAAALVLPLVLVDWVLARPLLSAADARPPWSVRRALLGARLDPAKLRALLWTALPLGLWGLLGALLQFIPQYSVERLLGQQQLGIFINMYSVLLGFAMLLAALNEAVIPRLAHGMVSGDRAGYLGVKLKFVGLVALICAAMVGGVVVFGRLFLQLAYGPSYAVHAPMFAWLAAAAAVGFVGGALSASLMAGWLFRRLLLATGVIALSSTLLHWTFVSRDGLFGTVYAMAGVAAVTVAVNVILFVQTLRGVPRT